MTSPVNLLDPLPRISNFRSDNVKFVSVFVCYLPLYVKSICLLFDVCVRACTCRNCARFTTLQVHKWRG